jgi:hypothetical protein
VLPTPAIAAESPRTKAFFEAYDTPIEMSARCAGTQIKITKTAFGQGIDGLGEKDSDPVKLTMGNAIADIKSGADITVQHEQQHTCDRGLLPLG